MAKAVLCRGCKTVHDPLVGCSRAKRMAENEAARVADLVRYMNQKAKDLAACVEKPVVTKKARVVTPKESVVTKPLVVTSYVVTRNLDRHKDKEAHREYMRKRARDRRALAKKMREAGEKLDAQPVPTKGRKLECIS